MISILLTCYEWDVCELVQDLLVAGQSASTDYEIIVLDDASPDPTYYKQIDDQFADNPSVRYERNEKNLGRSATRNQLASMAQGNIIIFIDGDSRIQQPDRFIANYQQAIKQGVILIGGRAYTPEPPRPDVKLHWTYGRQREVQSLPTRIAEPLRYFFSNNFCCYKSDFQPFDESITTYGYEDSLWAALAMNRGLTITHIDNPVVHIGLHSTRNFLKNAREAVTTLHRAIDDPALAHVRLRQFYEERTKSSIGQILLSLSALARPMCEWMLCRGITNLKVYDLFRVGLLKELQSKSNSALH